MAKKTYPNTPEEEAARINAESGDPNGITAEQVASNRAFNENLTNALGFGEGGSGFSLSENPFAKLVSGVSEQVQTYTEDAGAALPEASAALNKANIDQTVNRLSGGLGSGLNGATSGNFLGMEGMSQSDIDWELGDMASDVVDSGTSLPGGLSGGLSSLTDSASALVNKFPGGSEITSSLSKLTGGDLAGGIQSLAGGISKAAGALNDILSLKRGANIPSGAELFNQTGQEVKLSVGPKADWRVKINTQWNYFDSPLFSLLSETGGVVFPILPNITLSTSAEYNSINPVHNNYPFMSYKSSRVDDINVSGQFPAETETDAAYWLAATTFFRTATKMFYGQGEHAGNPPIICYLSGYGASVFDNVPVVIKNFSVDFPSDVNYIKCNTFGTSTWVPILSTITIMVAPIYNRRNLRTFNLKDFSSGKMTGTGGVGYL